MKPQNLDFENPTSERYKAGILLFVGAISFGFGYGAGIFLQFFIPFWLNIIGGGTIPILSPLVSSRYFPILVGFGFLAFLEYSEIGEPDFWFSEKAP